MFFIIQITLPRDRVFCGWQKIGDIFEPIFLNSTDNRASMFETKDEAQDTIDCSKQLKGCLVASLRYLAD